ncbi:5'/3'-nucleotidase SurE [Allorhizocola rhizosphaerae]|uniref:5'/3'-nucleotidase SurE n=1 Tax=Allorhizocola rhizosphaerae TaxID=1872709 RepID=UPI000E3B7904|nr:5'/3'-nucleotidase SurE [Allorhizocola rhizosphaerae]
MTLALITNDDGIDSPGLHELARAARKSGLDVVVAAPSREASGSSASISAVAENDRIMMEERHLSGLDDVKAFAVVGSPGLIALLATRGAFGDPPHLILSGINAGANAGHAILHSGTVGAAFTGAVNGCRAMAVSLDIRGINPNGRRHWESAGALVPQLVPMLEELPASTVLNVNVPDVPSERVVGLRRATLGGFGQVQMRIAERGIGFARTALEEREVRHEPGTDMALLDQGFATVTPIAPMYEVPVQLAI